MIRPLRRAVLIVLDGVGIGALPDAAAYGDAGANTLLHVAEAVGGLQLPILQRLGLGNILSLPGVPASPAPQAAYGRMAERSAGKDSTTGHWEIAGVRQSQPFPTYPEGFPEALLAEFTARTGYRPLGNLAISGTEVLRRYGEEHLRSGQPIVYTSVDSVFQIAAHEAVIPVEDLYALCRTTRVLLNPWRIGRVIARPFVGSCAADFRRTPRRHDFSLPPTAPTLLDRLLEAGLPVAGVGKVGDLFAGRGLSSSRPSESNRHGMELILEAMQAQESGLIFTNLVDFDMEYGHRLDAAGFARALAEFDAWLPRLLAQLDHEDLLLITADHGCDPTTPGTDHSREYVPLLAWRAGGGGGDLGTRDGFDDVAATLAQGFGLNWPGGGGFLRELA